MDVISKMSHNNLVRLLGYCDEADEQILVYEFVSNGNLREHIQNVGRKDSIAPHALLYLATILGLFGTFLGRRCL